MRKVWIYPDKGEKYLLGEEGKGVTSRKDKDPKTMNQKEQVMRGYYKQECSGQWRSSYSKDTVKRVWD